MERPDLEAATEDIKGVVGRAGGMEAAYMMSLGTRSPTPHVSPFWVSGWVDLLVLHRDCTALTTVADGRSILREGDMVGCEGSKPGILTPLGLGAGVC